MRKAACLWMLVLVAGCGGMPLDPTAGRSVSARSSCRDFGFQDATIDIFFDVVRIDRDAGFTELEEANIAVPACRGDFGAGCPENPIVFDQASLNECILTCSGCFFAIVRTVYAE